MIERIQRWWRRRKLIRQGINPDRKLTRQERRRMKQLFRKAVTKTI